MSRAARNRQRRDESAVVPTFSITAEDAMAPGLVMIWAAFRNGDLAGALREFNELAQSEAAQAYEEAPDANNANRAVSLAEAMDEWAGAGDGD